MNNDGSGSALRFLIPILIIGLLCSLMIYLAERFTHVRIEENRQMAKIRIIDEVMSLPHNNNLIENKIDIPALSTSAYRASLDNKFVGLVFMPIYANGFNGKISLVIGITHDGILSGVRILEQHESEGLGDGIDQDKSDWIRQFDRRSLSNTENKAWAVVKDGGSFDQLSGATISPRSVIKSVKNTLEYYNANRQTLSSQNKNSIK
tara:strand:- start:12 stop:629 length:618 start_codon:yes stop_codon:yes gene_type:complete